MPLFWVGPHVRAADNDGLSLRVTWNNPFCPAKGEVTKFDYQVRGQDRTVRLLIYTSDGQLVRQWTDLAASADTVYTQTWDGRNDAGGMVVSGTYFVLLDAGDGLRRVRRAVVRNE